MDRLRPHNSAPEAAGTLADEILGSIADRVVAFDRSWRYIYVSRRAATSLGKTPEGMLGKSIWEVFPESADTQFREACERAWREDRPVRIERYSTVLNTWVEVYIYPFENGASAEWHDITGRKRAEEALCQSEARYRQLIETALEGVWVLDPRGRTEYVNQRMAEILKYDSPEDLIGREVVEFVFDEDRERIADRFSGKHSRASGQRREMRFRAKDGSGVWVSFAGNALRDEAGRVTGWMALFTDITEHKRSDEALAAAVQRLEAHMDNSPLAVVEFDPQFRVIRWSKGAERVFGWTAGEVLGRSMTEFRWIYEGDMPAVTRVSQQMLAGTEPRNLSVNRNYRKDGAVVECEWYNSAIYNPDGSLASILSRVLDITERKRSEERLRQAQKLESIGVLAGGVAHDFNNLLTGIMGNASLVLDEVGPAQAQKIKDVIASAERAANLTRQLLAYSGKGQFVVRDLDVSEAVQEMIGLVQFSIPRSTELAVTLRPRLPAVRMDPSQLQQILMNLVINAGEAIGEARPGKIAISTATSEIGNSFIDATGQEVAPGRYVAIEVADTGSGIEEDKRSNIFDPFFTTKFTGRGLGLAAVAGILRSSKGAIVLETAPGRGSLFRVLLPVAERPMEWSGGTADDGRLTILVIDDEAPVRDFIATVLLRQGYRVFTASDGREALAVYERENGRVDGLLLDVVMPVMGANELLPKVKEGNPSLKVLLTSGYSEAEARRLCAAYPGAAFIQKPYTARQIAAAVEALVGAARPE